ncbi:MAG TPA: helix-hairpin-helix domain-containing protein [Bacteroidia bacterium]|nr:helix-hairpin-helix domain-containing protein [Bacteroidia bacterium]
MLKKFIKEWYTLNKTQRRGTIVVLILLLSSVLFKWLYVPKLDDEVIYFANLEIEKFEKPDLNTSLNFSVTKKDTLFFFNPNLTSEKELQEIGLPEKIVQNIIKYRNAGGKFYSKESLKKIYSMNDSIYQRIEPYILIDNNNTSKNNTQNFSTKTNYKPTKSKPYAELNSADSLELENLSGIGKTLSVRIIKYRNRLGGFYSVYQLKEVYGLNDSLFNFVLRNNELKADTTLIHKINIKTADFKTMIRHPYFTKEMVIKILQLQKNKTNFSTQILKQELGEENWNKVRWYVEF